MKRDRFEEQSADAVGNREQLPENPGEDWVTDDDWALIAMHFQLSARELGVAVLLFEGNSRFQIAQKLACAPGTVRVYIDRLFAKLNVQDRLGMALRVVRVYLGITQVDVQEACRTRMRLA
jgi:DNA-binding NarL/FixJ family response regulator